APMGPSDSPASFGLGFGRPSSSAYPSRERQGSPRLLGHPHRPRHDLRPRSVRPPSCGLAQGGRCCLRITGHRGHRAWRHFGAALPRLSSLAHLRIALALPLPAQGSLPACLPVALTGRDSHPLDTFSAFPEFLRLLLSCRPTFPGRTRLGRPGSVRLCPASDA